METKPIHKFGSDGHNPKTEFAWKENLQTWKAKDRGNSKPTSNANEEISVSPKKGQKIICILEIQDEDIENLLHKKLKIKSWKTLQRFRETKGDIQAIYV